MLVEERRDRIVSIINMEGKVYVKELSRGLGVTTETIRKDLDYLSSREKVLKVHGGALKVEEKDTFDLVKYYKKRENKMYQEKSRVAKAASELIEDGDVIALDIGTSIVRIINYLKGKKDLTILLNSIGILLEIVRLSEEVTKSWKIFFLGGEVNKNLMSVSGTLTNKNLEDYHVEKFFMACDGLDKEVTSNNCNEAMLASKLMKRSKNVVLLADSSKVGKRYFNKICNINEVDTLVIDSNNNLPRNLKESIDIIIAR